jgi:hypothetical protein
MAARRACAAALAGLTLGAPPPSRAAGPQIVDDPAVKTLISCLTPVGPDLPPVVYPREALPLKKDVTVRVRLVFRAPDAPPRAEVLYNNGDEAFEKALSARLASYRLPCLPAGASPVTFTQEFRFDPRDGRPVEWLPARVPASHGTADCTAEHRDPRDIIYPPAARKRGIGGTVLVEGRFNGPGEAPVVTVLNRDAPEELAEVAMAHFAKTRLVCSGTDQRWPKLARQTFRFSMEGDKRYVLRDVPLATFLRTVKKDAAGTPVRFDLRSMACPFDVQLNVYQPHLANSVGEVGTPDPNRAEFLHWLAGLTLDLPPEAAQQVLGDTMRISVPCGVIDFSS